MYVHVYIALYTVCEHIIVFLSPSSSDFICRSGSYFVFQIMSKELCNFNHIPECVLIVAVAYIHKYLYILKCTIAYMCKHVYMHACRHRYAHTHTHAHSCVQVFCHCLAGRLAARQIRTLFECFTWF